MPGNIQSVERAAALLRLLAAGSRRLGIAELAGALGLAKGTVHGILRTLHDVGFVEQDEETGKYQLGAALLHLGSSYLDVNELRTRALNWSDALAARSHEAVYIGTVHDGSVLVVHHVFRPDDSMQALEVGALLPVHATALGKVLMAFDPVMAGELDAPHERFTEHTLTDPEALSAELEEVRGRGWAADVEEHGKGLVSVGAPIYGRQEVVVGAISISGAVERLCSEGEVRMDLVSYVRDAARSITRDLGGHR